MSESELKEWAKQREKAFGRGYVVSKGCFEAGFLKAIEVAEALAEDDLPPDAERNAVRRGMRDIVAELKKTAGV